MITAEAIRQLQKQEPFVPFSIHLSDGRHFDIQHPEFLMVFRNSVVIGVPERDKDIPERSHTCSILHITSIDRVAA